jgi:4-amino-4-deoxy-L-arabinose transferase-like glycosyltransferase
MQFDPVEGRLKRVIAFPPASFPQPARRAGVVSAGSNQHRRNLGKRLVILLALALILGRFVTQGYARILTNSNSSSGDQGAFLQLSLDMRESGRLTDGTRNPLYAAVLVPWAQRNTAFFTYAKTISTVFGLLAIIALYVLGSRRFGCFTGLVAAYLLSINTEFIVHSATALTDSLLTFIFILAWFAMIEALDHERQPGFWALAGVLGGLAYLAKGSGQLLVMAFLVATFLIFRWRMFRLRGVWVFLGCYLLTVSPLWVYNAIHFGSPTFSYPTTHQMWMNTWNDWHPDDVDDLPTLLTYVQGHSVTDIVTRQWSGMAAMRNILIKTLWPTRRLVVDRFLMSPLSRVVLAVLAVLPFIFWHATKRYVQGNRPAVYLTLLTTLLFFVLFAWYIPIVPLGQRFVLPVIPLIFLSSAHVADRIGRALMARGTVGRRVVVATVTIFVVFQLGWAVGTNVEQVRATFAVSVLEQDARFSADAASALTWLTNQHPSHSVVAWGPSGKSLPTWAFSDQIEFQRYPPHVEDMPALTAELNNRQIDYVIVAPEMFSRYRSAFEEYLTLDGGRVGITQIPAGWALSYAYPGVPCDWCVFRLVRSNPPQNIVTYQVGEAVQLEGYDLQAATAKPGGILYLTLHWTARAPITQDFTVFTQLLGSDFQLHGQRDNQPLNDSWPTSRWQRGDHLADTYAIPVEEHAPPGAYQLLVGMYDGQTGVRQPVWQEGGRVPDDAIRLATITVVR